MREQLKLFPWESESGKTQDEGLKQTEKLLHLFKAGGRHMPRKAFNSMVACLTIHFRGDREWPDYNEVKSRLPRGKELPEDCTLKNYIEDYEKYRPAITDYVNGIKLCPVCDYLGQIAGEQGVLNNRDQFFTPPSLVQLMVDMNFHDREPDKPVTVSDPACGTGRFSLYTLMVQRDVIFFSNDVDIDMVRAAIVTHQLFFPVENIFEERGSAWFILCADTIAQGQLGAFHPDWLHANMWDQPYSLRS